MLQVVAKVEMPPIPPMLSTFSSLLALDGTIRLVLINELWMDGTSVTSRPKHRKVDVTSIHCSLILVIAAKPQKGSCLQHRVT